MAAKCVLVLIRWLNAIIDISDTKTIRTATEERWYTLYTSQEARRLAFNKMVYSKERVKTFVTRTYSLILINLFSNEFESTALKTIICNYILLDKLK